MSALEDKLTSGFVIVLEDTTDLLRAQKASAWNEVARRVAHEIKNPLTPIALSAGRIARQLSRATVSPEVARIVQECTDTIVSEVQSVKTLVDEFSQLSRFPAAQLARADLNEVVESALSVFAGRLDSITIRVDFAPDLPSVLMDPEQFKRVVVNLVDNAAEAMPGIARQAALCGDAARCFRNGRVDCGGYRLRHYGGTARETLPSLLLD